MKKILITTAATAALALATPAFAQVLNDVTGTVHGQARVQGQVDPQDVTDPLAQTQQATQDAVRGQVDEAQDALPQSPEASVTAEGAAQVPGVSGEGQVSAQITPPATDTAEETADEAIDTADAAADAVTDTATEAAPTVSAEADMAVTASAGTRGASASTETAAEATADMPAPLQQAVNDGSYTTDDLNRAQLAALQSPTQGSR